MIFEAKHGEAAARSIKMFRKKRQREKIERDGLSADRNVRRSQKHAEAIEHQKDGRFPKQEEKVFHMFVERRMQGLVVKGMWLRKKMLELVREEQPSWGKDQNAWQKFQATDRWIKNFSRRFGITNRQRSNKKPKTAKEREKQVQKFHRTAKKFRKPPPQNDKEY